MMRERMRAALLEAAAEGRTVTYGEIAAVVSDGRVSARSAALAALLGEVCEMEDPKRDVLMGSLVVRADTRVPGEGYFRHTGLLDAGSTDQVEFWQAQVERVWDAYRPEA